MNVSRWMNDQQLREECIRDLNCKDAGAEEHDRDLDIGGLDL